MVPCSALLELKVKEKRHKTLCTPFPLLTVVERKRKRAQDTVYSLSSSNGVHRNHLPPLILHVSFTPKAGRERSEPIQWLTWSTGRYTTCTAPLQYLQGRKLRSVKESLLTRLECPISDSRLRILWAVSSSS